MIRELEMVELEDTSGGDMVIYYNNGDGTATKFYLVGEEVGFEVDRATGQPTNLIADKIYGPEVVSEREVAYNLYRQDERENYNPAIITRGW